MNDIVKLLDAEIEKTIREVSDAQTGSDEARAALTKLDKLHNERIKELEAALKHRELDDSYLTRSDEMEVRKQELEQRAKQAETDRAIKEAELVQKEAELQETKRGRRWRTFLDILGIGMPLAATSYWMYKGLKFEEDGKIYSGRTSQWVSNFFRLFKK